MAIWGSRERLSIRDSHRIGVYIEKLQVILQWLVNPAVDTNVTGVLAWDMTGNKRHMTQTPPPQ